MHTASAEIDMIRWPTLCPAGFMLRLNLAKHFIQNNDL
jgi:hypothetical protein